MSKTRVTALRAALQQAGFDGWIQPRADEFQGEYVPPSAARLAWLTGFTGSAGSTVVLQHKAAVFSDGRYTLQLAEEIDGDVFDARHSINDPPSEWVTETLPKGARLAYDPWLLTEGDVKRFGEAAEKAGGELVPAAANLVDAIWTDRPAPPQAPILPHPLEFAGRSSAEKRQELAQALADDDIDAALLTQPDGIAWLLNVRGGDVENTPLPLSFAILHQDGRIDWFVDPMKLSTETRAWLGNGVETHPVAAFADMLDAFTNKRVLTPAVAPAAVSQRLQAVKAVIVKGQDPTALPKAQKNNTEIAGARTAHQRDAVAMAKFLHWLDTDGQSGNVTELQASDKLESFRRELDHFRDLSFPTISGAGPNGAIVHYRVTAETSRPLERDTLYLVDSGGQFLDGTTDITRTVSIGDPTDEMRRAYTLVLKGHLALSAARFPKGATGAQLDSLARAPLWAAGLDFDHGTGHGVGSYLSVHEGPQRISKAGDAALEVGMILSNEPGYYKAGAFGIRIENLLLVETTNIPDGERDMLGFETLTLAPYDRRLIDCAMLTAPELTAIDAYHQRVHEAVGPMLNESARKWLSAMTAPLL
ncbi:MAG: M24 family metallopeptidase [Alphaproteobacteria bacterium]